MRKKAVSLFLAGFVLLLPIATYAWYVAARRAEIGHHNLQELGRAAENLRATVDDAVLNVENLDPGYACSLDHDQPYLTFRNPADCGPFKGAERGNSDLRGAQGRVTIEVLPKQSPADAGKKPATPGPPVPFDLNVSKVLGELTISNSFEYLLVADENADVVFQENHGADASWNDASRWFDQYSRPNATSIGDAVQLVNLSELPLTAGAKAKYEDLKQASTSVRIVLAGADYDLFVQPLRFQKVDKIWTLAGLVRVSTSTREAMLIAPQFTFALVVLLVLGLLAWPFIKRWALAPNERPTFADGYLLLLSTSATLMVATVVLLNMDNYRVLNQKAVEGLKSLAQNVRLNFVDELKRMRHQLREYDESLKDWSGPVENCDKLTEVTNLLAGSGQIVPCESASHVRLPEPTQYRAFDLVFWAGPGGDQILKATTGAHNTSRVSVASRAYFQEASAGRLWIVAGGSEPDPGFVVQPVRSMTTGEFSCALSIRSNIDPRICESPNAESSGKSPAKPVAVLAAPLSSVGDQALPSGYGFAVVDPRGLVLFHSDRRRSLRESLLDELDAPDRLRAALLSTSPQTFTAGYQTRLYEFYVLPIEELILAASGSPGETKPRPVGWHVVAYRDLDVNGGVDGQVFATSFLWIFGYALLFQVAPTLIALIFQPRRVRWLWPNGFNAPLYRRLTIQLALVALVSLVLYRLSDPNTLFWVTLLSPLVTVAISLGNYFHWEPKSSPQNWHGCNRPALKGRGPTLWHFSTVMLEWILLAVLPAGGFFKLAWDEEFGRLAAYENVQQQDQAADIKRAIEEKAKQIAGREKLVQDRSQFLSYAIAPFATSSETATSGVEHPSFFRNYSLRLNYGELSARLRYQRADSERLNAAGLLAGPGWRSLGGVLLLLGALSWWIRYSANKLLFADIDDQPVSDQGLLCALLEPKHDAILVVAPQPDQERRILEKLPCRIGSGGSALAASVGGSPVIQRAAGPRAVISTGLEKELPSNELRRAKLEEFENVLEAKGRLIAFSRLDPFEYVSRLPQALWKPGDKTPAPDGPHTQADETARWRALQERFSVIKLGYTAEEIGNGDDCKRDQNIGQPGSAMEVMLAPQPPYRSLWDSCSDLEKMVLIHVAEEGFANPAQRKTVRQLMRRGLLVMQPDLRVVNGGFRAFIRQEQDPALVSRWEKPVGKIGWDRAKWILVVLLLAIGVFLFSTQREWFTTGEGAVAALTGILSGIFKLTDQLSRGKAAA